MSTAPAAPPAATDIIAARKAAGLTQSQAAALVCASLRTWQQWEAGDRRMPAGLFALFLLRQPKAPKKAATDTHASGTPGARVVAASRQAAGLTVAEAAKLCHRTAKEWLCAESGLRPLDTAAWELYLLRVGQHPQWTLAPRRKA